MKVRKDERGIKKKGLDGKMFTEEEINMPISKEEIYEMFFHKMYLCSVSMNEDKLKEGVGIILSWSRAHTSGNGELTDEEQRARIQHWVDKMDKY